MRKPTPHTSRYSTHHRLLTCTLSSAMRWLISLPEADRPFNMNGAVLELAERLRRMIRFDFPFAPLSSISMWPSSLSFLTKDLRSCARPKTCNVGNKHDRNCQRFCHNPVAYSLCHLQQAGS